MDEVKSLTITEGFRRAIGDRRVLHAFFTTFSFEPDFFELEVVPLLLSSPALSPNELIRYAQVQDLMRDQRDVFAVAYDYDAFGQEMSGRLEVEYRPERVPGGCHHAKLAILEVENSADKTTTLLLCAGSFNLTKAGWWENIEVGHWYELGADRAPANIVQPLRDALSYYTRSRPSPVIEALLHRLKHFRQTEDDPEAAFYFSFNGSGKKHRHFDQFLADAIPPDKSPIEIISPFFAEDGSNRVITDFLGRFTEAAILLPKDSEGNALIDEAVYKSLSATPTQWAAWSKEVGDRFCVPKHGDIWRNLHAKVYHIHGKRPRTFVGSVNFSYKAFRMNVEAGFLLHNAFPGRLLTYDHKSAERFAPPSEQPDNQRELTGSMPVIHLSYDWLTGELEVSSARSGQLCLHDSSGQALETCQLIADQSVTRLLPGLAAHLQRSALVDAAWSDSSGTEQARRLLLVSQKSICARPTILPALQLQDLLSMYLDVGNARRSELVAAQAALLLSKQHDAIYVDEFAPAIGDAARSTFFSAFSQVNGAFWMLRKKLREATDKGNTAVLDYYLRGCQPDSLRGILDASHPARGEAAPVVVRYLTLLSVAEVFHEFVGSSIREQDRELSERIEACLRETEQAPEFDTIPEREQFLAYIRTVFHMPVAELAKRVANHGKRHAEH